MQRKAGADHKELSRSLFPFRIFPLTHSESAGLPPTVTGASTFSVPTVAPTVLGAPAKPRRWVPLCGEEPALPGGESDSSSSLLSCEARCLLRSAILTGTKKGNKKNETVRRWRKRKQGPKRMTGTEEDVQYWKDYDSQHPMQVYFKLSLVHPEFFMLGLRGVQDCWKKKIRAQSRAMTSRESGSIGGGKKPPSNSITCFIYL